MEKVKELLEPIKKLADENMDFTYTFAAIGLGYVSYECLKQLYSTYKYTLRPSYDLLKRYGDNWAVVTGASDGIGKAFVFELAKRGVKTVLVGRNQEKLDAAVKEINEKYPNIELKTVVFEFNVHYTEEKVKELTDKFEFLDKVSIVINNVGTAAYDPIEKMSYGDIHKQINVNIVGTTVFTQIMVPKLRANEARAGMVFIGSSSTESASPNLAVYSASKSYVQQFGISVADELKDKIDTLVVQTSSVKSNMNSGRYLFTITPEQHAKAALDKLGLDTHTLGHHIHAIRYHYSNRPIEGAIIRYINRRRKEQFIKERETEKRD